MTQRSPLPDRRRAFRAPASPAAPLDAGLVEPPFQPTPPKPFRFTDWAMI